MSPMDRIRAKPARSLLELERNKNARIMWRPNSHDPAEPACLVAVVELRHDGSSHPDEHSVCMSEAVDI